MCDKHCAALAAMKSVIAVIKLRSGVEAASDAMQCYNAGRLDVVKMLERHTEAIEQEARQCTG